MTKDSVNLKGQNDTNKQTNTQMFVVFKIQITHLKNSEVSETATFSHILGEVMTLMACSNVKSSKWSGLFFY